MCVCVANLGTQLIRTCNRGRMGEAYRAVSIPNHAVCLEDQHVKQGSLPVMEMPKHSDASYHLWKVHHIHEESGVQQKNLGQSYARRRVTIGPTPCRSAFQAGPFLRLPTCES